MAQKLLEMMTVREFCQTFAVSPATLYRLRQRGVIPILKVGRASRIRCADAAKWAASLQKLEG